VGEMGPLAGTEMGICPPKAETAPAGPAERRKNLRICFVPASMDRAKLESVLRSYNLSPGGAAWLVKALHPVEGEAAPIPDAVDLPTILPDYRLTNVLTKPTGLATANWDACIVGIGSDVVPLLWAAGAAGIDFRTDNAPESGVHQAVDTVVAAGGTQTAVCIPQAGGAAVVREYDWYHSLENPTGFRVASKSVTVYATGSELYNQGTVYVGQYSRMLDPGAGESTDATAPFSVLGTNIVSLPLSEEDMAVMTPDLYTAPAREGAYIVHRLTGPSQEMVRKRTVESWWDATGYKCFSTVRPTGRSLPTSQVLRFRMGTENVSPAFPYVVPSTGFDEKCTFSVAIFRGLHENMSLTIKSNQVLELLPSTTSPSRQFVRPSGLFDPQAMNAYYAIIQRMPDAVAAKHNFLGTLLPILASIAARVLPFLRPVAAAALSAGASALATKVVEVVGSKRSNGSVAARSNPGTPRARIAMRPAAKRTPAGARRTR